jgi:ParB/RepB/Spo0J family partition protein
MSTAAAPVHTPQPTIALAALSPFKLNPRKNITADSLKTLAESIKLQGVIQPILARPNGGPGKFEIVAGERRWRAAKLAGLTEIPANVRVLTDAQALELAVVENNQREDLHPLEEAEGYEALLKCKHEDGRPYTVEDIVSKISRSKSYVYQKLKLCELTEEARKAFYAGKLDFSKAVMVARIPSADLQKQALKEITDPHFYGAPMTARQAADHLQRKYMLQLDRAPFAVKDAALVPAAGACTTCPKRSGNSPELFADVKSGDVCTDPDCFESKRNAQIIVIAKQAKDKGMEVITGKDARRIAPHGTGNDLKGGYAALDRQIPAGNSWKLLRHVLGKDVPKVTLLQDADTGKLVEVVKSADIAPILKAKLPKSVRPSSSASADSYTRRERVRQDKAKAERELRRRLYFAGRDHVAAKGLGIEDVRLLVKNTWERLWHDNKRVIAPWWIAEEAKNASRIEALTKRIASMGGEDLMRLLVDCSIVYELNNVDGHGSTAASTSVEAFARRHGVDTAKIKREISTQAREKAAAKKAKGKSTKRAPARKKK